MKKLTALLTLAFSSFVFSAVADDDFQRAIRDPQGLKIGHCVTAASFTAHSDLAALYQGKLQQYLAQYSLSPEQQSQAEGYLLGRSAGQFNANPAGFGGVDKKTAAQNYIDGHCYQSLIG